MTDKPIMCLIRRDDGVHEGHINFTEGELLLPGFVEHVEKMYDGTQWRVERKEECPLLEPKSTLVIVSEVPDGGH